MSDIHIQHYVSVFLCIIENTLKSYTKTKNDSYRHFFVIKQKLPFICHIIYTISSVGKRAKKTISTLRTTFFYESIADCAE